MFEAEFGPRTGKCLDQVGNVVAARHLADEEDEGSRADSEHLSYAGLRLRIGYRPEHLTRGEVSDGDLLIRDPEADDVHPSRLRHIERTLTLRAQGQGPAGDQVGARGRGQPLNFRAGREAVLGRMRDQDQRSDGRCEAPSDVSFAFVMRSSHPEFAMSRNSQGLR